MTSFHHIAGLTARAHEWAGFAAGMQLKLWRQAAEAALQAPYEQMRMAHSMMEAQRRLMGANPAAAETAPEAKAEPAAEAKAAAKTEPKADAKPEAKAESAAEPKLTAAEQTQARTKPAAKAARKPAAKKPAVRKTATRKPATRKAPATCKGGKHGSQAGAGQNGCGAARKRGCG